MPTTRLTLECPPCGTILEYWYIIDFSVVHIQKIAKHKYLRNEEDISLGDPAVSSLGVWDRKKPKLEYIIRMTHQEFSDLLTCLVRYTIIYLTDTAYGATNWRVWLAEASSDYEGHMNADRPWKVTLTFIVICEPSGCGDVFPMRFPLVLS